MRIASLIASVVLAGCLSSPEPRAGDGDAGIDGNVAAGMAFPPDGANIGIRELRTLDVNGDDVDDLVISNNPNGTTDRGIYILLGPQSDVTALEYHVFIATTAEPLDFIFHDIVGDNGLDDLIIFGPTGPDVLVEVYEQVAELEFATSALQSRPAPIQGLTTAAPNLLAVAALDDGLKNDIVVSDLDELYAYVYTDPVQNIPLLDPVPLGRDGSANTNPFTGINGILTRPTPGDSTDDLVIIENLDANWLGNDGAGGLTNQAMATSPAQIFSLFTAQDSPLGSTSDTILGAGPDGPPGGYRLGAGAPSLTPVTWDVDEVASDGFSDLLVGDLDALSTVEVVILDTTGLVDVRVRVFRNANESGNAIMPSQSMNLTVPGLRPAQGAIADFDNDGSNEIWVMSLDDGDAACVQLVNNALTSCASD